MDQDTKKIIRDRLDKLPKEVTAAIKSISLPEKIKKIIEDNKFTEEIEDAIIFETIVLVLGIESAEKYIENLKKNAGLDDETADKISIEVGETILDSIVKLTNKTEGKTIDPAFAKKRLAEIVNKYGLTTSQATVLENEVMSVIDRNLGEKITTQDLTNLLNISNLLAEQIVYELEARVFEGGVKAPEKPRVSVDTAPKPEPTVSFGNTTLNVPKEMMKPAFQNEALDSQKTSTSTSIGVPRYATEDIYKPTQPASNPIVNNKLNTVTPSIRPIETKYQKDPYREPLE